jgi:hypothetical protein
VYAERAVVVGGKQYVPGYEIKKAKIDSLFSSASVDEIKRISNELKVDYIVFDKWNGGRFACRDTTLLNPVFTNKQVDIYKLKRI